MRTYLLLIMMLVIGCISAIVDAGPGPERIRIELSPSNRLAIGDIDDMRFASPKDQNGFHAFYEEIKRVPVRYTVTDTCFICVQQMQLNSWHYGPVPGDALFFDSDGTLLYSDTYVDCIISICTIFDPFRGECIIVDSNNDEDLTNDPIQTYSDKTIRISDKEYACRCVDTEATIDYYDGTRIQTMNVPVRFYEKIPEINAKHQYRLNHMQIGEITFEDHTYTVGMPMMSNIEMYHSAGEWGLSARLWIDLNRNGQFEWDDFYDHIYRSFTLFGKTYRRIECDRFGRYLVLEELDEQ